MAKKATKSTPKTKTVEIICYNAAGKYKLPYSFGAKVKLDTKLAEEMINNGDAK